MFNNYIIRNNIWQKIKESLFSILPISLIVVVLGSCVNKNSFSNGNAVISGAGATFPYPYYNIVFRNYMRQHQGVISGAAHIAALQKAVQSNELAVRAAERGYRGGTNSIREILDSQERLYQAQLDLTQSRLEYVMARLKLAAAADGLDGALIAETSQTFFADTAISVD